MKSVVTYEAGLSRAKTFSMFCFRLEQQLSNCCDVSALFAVSAGRGIEILNH